MKCFGLNGAGKYDSSFVGVLPAESAGKAKMTQRARQLNKQKIKLNRKHSWCSTHHTDGSVNW
jgi:hypothetical protein